MTSRTPRRRRLVRAGLPVLSLGLFLILSLPAAVLGGSSAGRDRAPSGPVSPLVGATPRSPVAAGSASPGPPGSLRTQYTLDLVNDSIIRGNYIPGSIDEPNYVAFDSLNDRLYVSGRGGITVLSPSTLDEVADFPNDTGGALAFDPTTDQILDAGGGRVATINPASGAIIGSVSASDAEDGGFLAFVPYENVVVVGGEYEGSADIVNLTSANVTATISISDSFAMAAVYDPVNRNVYIGEHDNNAVLVVDSANWSTLTSVSLNNYSLFFYGLGLDPVTGNVYASTLFNGFSDVVVEISGANESIIASRGIGQFTSSIVYDNSTGDVYVADSIKKSMYVLDAGNLSYVKTIAIPAESSPITGQWYPIDVPTIASIVVPEGYQGGLVFVGTANDTAYAELPSAPNLGYTIYDPSDGCYVIDDESGPDLTFVNATRLSVEAVVPINLTIVRGLAFDLRENAIWVPGYDPFTSASGIEVLNASTAAEVHYLPDSSRPTGAVIDPADRRVFVSNLGSTSVSVYNETNLTAPAVSIPIGQYGVTESYSSDSDQVWITDSGQTNVTVVNASTETMYENVRTGAGPWPVWYDAPLGEVFTGNEAGDNVSKIGALTDRVLGALAIPYVQAFASGTTAGPLYVTNGSGNILAVNVTAGTWTNLSAGESTDGVALDPAGDLGASDDGDGAFYLLSPTAFPLLANISLSAQPYVVSVGGNLSLDASATGGVGSLTYAYSGLPNGCSSANTSALTCQPTGSGSYVVRLTVHDGDGHFGNASARIWIDPVYPVWFNETGLPSGVQWWLTEVGGTTVYSTGTSIELSEPNGTYEFTYATANLTYSSGALSVTVHGGELREKASFQQTAFLVTFTESGLPTGTTWTANFDGQKLTADAGTPISAYLADGTYPYSFSTSNSSWGAAGGTVPVSGGSVDVGVTFTLVRFETIFLTSGLPSGASWWLNLSGQAPQISDAVGYGALLANGSISYTAQAVGGNWSSIAGTGRVQGAGQTIHLDFQLIDWPVGLTAAGLPSGVSWWFNITGRPSDLLTVPSTALSLSNGTYRYGVGVEGPYVPNATGSTEFTVAGSRTATVLVGFHSAIGTTRPAVTRFTASPNPATELSSVSFSATVVGGDPPLRYDYRDLPGGCPAPNSGNFSCVPTANGTFNVTLTATDAHGLTASSNVTLVVQAAPPKENSHNNPPPTGNHPASGGSSLNTELLAAGVGVAVVAAVALLLLLRRRRSGGGPTSSADRPEEPAPEADPPAGEAPPGSDP